MVKKKSDEKQKQNNCVQLSDAPDFSKLLAGEAGELMHSHIQEVKQAAPLAF